MRIVNLSRAQLLQLKKEYDKGAKYNNSFCIDYDEMCEFFTDYEDYYERLAFENDDKDNIKNYDTDENLVIYFEYEWRKIDKYRNKVRG